MQTVQHKELATQLEMSKIIQKQTSVFLGGGLNCKFSKICIAMKLLEYLPMFPKYLLN